MTFLDAHELEKLFQACGLVGFFLYLASFAALQFKQIDGHGLMYSGLNVLAAALVLISLIVDFNLSSALIQMSWITIGCAGIFSRGLKRRKNEPSLSAAHHSRKARPPEFGEHLQCKLQKQTSPEKG